MTADLVITEKTSQAKDVRAAVGGRYGTILPAEGHLLTLREPEEVNPGWKRWSPVLLRPDGLYGTKPASGGNKAAKLQAIRAALILRMNLFHRKYDLLLTPTVAVPALPAGQDLNDPKTEKHWIDWTPFSYPFNMTRQPAASVPCGLTNAGLPIGLQIVGALFDDATVLRAARAFETMQPFVRPPA